MERAGSRSARPPTGRRMISEVGEKGPYRAVGPPVDLARCRGVVATEQHRLVERSRHDQPVELAGGEHRVGRVESALASQFGEGVAERGDRAPRAQLVEGPADVREL